MNRSENIRERARSLEESTFRELWTLVVECASILREIAPNRRQIWLQEVIEELFREQEGLCGLCGKPLQRGMHEVDHKIPFVYGGGNERANIQLAHPECNRKKRAAVDPRDLLRYLEDRYMNLPPR